MNNLAGGLKIHSQRQLEPSERVNLLIENCVRCEIKELLAMTDLSEQFWIEDTANEYLLIGAPSRL
jgi:hypothetical protein